MSVASITLEQIQTVEEGTTPDVPVYRVKNTIVASDNIPLALFVFTTAEGNFSHIATPRDLEAYGEQAEAAVEETTYYRASTVTLDFDRIEDAQAFAAISRSRLSNLAQTWPQAQSNFMGSSTYVYTTTG